MSRRRPPTRIVHLGLGAFFRAHQAWYTHAAPDAAEWGIAAFTGRSSALPDVLRARDGVYDLVIRGPQTDETVVPASLSEVHPGTDVAAWRRVWSSPRTAIATLTVTEAAYADPALAARLLDGLSARRAAGAGPIAIVPCDNLPSNGDVLRTAVTAAAGPALASWIGEHVSFVSTMVDRITPASPPAAPVVTEPYHEWVLSGDFPAGRPAWEVPGARFVADVRPHEQRKLWLLNGGHSLLAYAGGARGHETVADAVADPACRAQLERWWDEASPCLPLPPAEVADYRAALLRRWSNGRIRHRLEQIAADGSQKLPVRVLPVLRSQRAAGRLPAGAAGILAAWIRHLRGGPIPVRDAGAAPYVAVASSARAVLARLAPDLADDRELAAAVEP
ncbi:mannitol dehydrogenase family protein [Dactylosporangium sp. CA-139066]|uniref:mannitol dehydrogenase family protein n=1 Tax=Dactylosporangium sp. CA-139066 TaxID=3239930 RepID=UPI003D93B5B4